MFDDVSMSTTQLDLQRRIQMLEEQNRFLSEELERLKQIAESSRSGEALYRMLTTNLPNAAAFLVDQEIRYLLADGQALQAVGLSSKNLEGKTIQEVFDTETAARYEQLYRRALHGETFVWEHCNYNRDYVSHCAPVPNETGQIVAALIVSYDITERKQAEASLAESEQRQREIVRLLELDQARLAAVLQNLPVGVWIADQNGRLIGTNKQADFTWEGTSRPLNSPVEYQTYIAWHPETGKLLQPEEYPVAVALRTGQPVEPMELKIRHRDGSEGTALASAAPVRDHQDVLLGAVGVNIDITERKRLEEALRESEYRFRTMADGTPLIIWVTDSAGKMEFINKAYFEFFGVNLEEIRSGNWQMLVHPEDHAEYIDTYMASLREQSPFHAQCRVLRKDGQWRWVISEGQPRFSVSGEFVGMAGSSLDITERKQAEQTVLENQIQIELQQQLIGQREQERLLIAQDIHDGPIQTLAATMLEMQIARGEFRDATTHSQLDKLASNVQHAIQELRSIIAALRPPLLQRFGLSQAIQTHTDDFNNRHPEIELTHDLMEDEGKLSEEVCLSLFRIYQEALSNVIRHSGATKANVHLSFGHEMAVLTIEDNGRGMEVVPDSLARTEKGHYGLAGMKERAMAINGEFQVLSALGKGTTIIVKVPMAGSLTDLPNF
jgi:PAS domain S-box-containing protein